MDNDGADDYEVARGQKYLGYNVSNNQAEYEGLEDALTYMIEREISCHGLYVRGDSEIVLNQLNGIYQVRSDNIIGYYNAVVNKISEVDKTFVKYTHVDRSRNYEADELANDAINEREDYWS